MHRILALAMMALAIASSAAAQNSRVSGLAVDDRFLEANAGFSWYSPRGSAWGMITNRRVYLTGVRSEWVLEAEGRLAWAYLVEFVPVAIIERTRAGETLYCRPSGVCEVDRSTDVAVGTGIAPAGIKMYVNHTGRTRVFGSASAGMIAFSTDVPVYSSRRLNFMLDYGLGVDVALPDGRAATIGYRFHHISNAGSGRVNPGLDANIIYVGLRRKR